MKAILPCGTTVDLGPDTRTAIYRAGRLYRAGVFAKVILETPVPRAGLDVYSPIGGYWVLRDAGFLSRDEYPIRCGDDEYHGSDIVYTVIADIEFFDEYGNRWAKGDVDEWPK